MKGGSPEILAYFNQTPSACAASPPTVFNQTQRPVEGVRHPVEAVSGTQSRPQMAEKYFWRGPLSYSASLCSEQDIPALRFLVSRSWSSGASHPAPHPPALRTSAPRAPSPDAQLHYGPRASATLASTTLPTSSASPATTSSAADPLPHPPLPQLQVSPRREPRGVGLCQGRRRDAWPGPCRQRTRAPRWLRPGGGGFLREPLRRRVRSGLLAALALARPRLLLVL